MEPVKCFEPKYLFGNGTVKKCSIIIDYLMIAYFAVKMILSPGALGTLVDQLDMY